MVVAKHINVISDSTVVLKFLHAGLTIIEASTMTIAEPNGPRITPKWSVRSLLIDEQLQIDVTPCTS